MNDGLKKKVQENPILNDYCKKLESIGFELYNITKNAIGPIILAQKKDELLNELKLFIDPKSKLVDIEIKNRLVWTNYKELSVPGHNVKMKIQGEEDYNHYGHEHDFILSTITEKENIEIENLTTTIQSMLNEIKAANQALLKE